MTIPSASLERLAQIASGSTVERIGKALLHSLWEIAAVVLVVIVLLRLLRRSDPGVRYSVACAAMGLMAVLPALTFILIEAESSVAPQSLLEDGPPTHASAALQPEPRLEIQTNSVFCTQAETESQVDFVSSSAYGEIHVVPVVEDRKRESAPGRNAFQRGLDRTLPWLVAAWVLGVLFFSLKTLTSWFLLQRLRKESQPVLCGESITILHQIASRLGITRTLRLAWSSLVDVPTVFGWISPV